jgi:hypothetical protein
MTRDEIAAQGFILFPRAAHEALKAKPEKMRVFQAILHAAAFKPRNVNGVHIPYGGALMSLSRLIDETAWESNRQVKTIDSKTLRRYLDELEAACFISRTKTRLGTLIVVQNFDLYDDVSAYSRNLPPPNLPPPDASTTESDEKTYGDELAGLATTCPQPAHNPPTANLPPPDSENLPLSAKGVTDCGTESYSSGHLELATPKSDELATLTDGGGKSELATHLPPITLPSEKYLDGETDRPAHPAGDAGQSAAPLPEKVYLYAILPADLKHMLDWENVRLRHEVLRVATLFGEMYKARFGKNHRPMGRESWEKATEKLYETLQYGVADNSTWVEVIERYFHEWQGESPTTGEQRRPNFEAFVGHRMVSNLIEHMDEGRH